MQWLVAVWYPLLVDCGSGLRVVDNGEHAARGVMHRSPLVDVDIEELNKNL